MRVFRYFIVYYGVISLIEPLWSDVIKKVCNSVLIPKTRRGSWGLPLTVAFFKKAWWAYSWNLESSPCRDYNSGHISRSQIWTCHESSAIRAWWRHQMETFFALLAICARNSPVSGEFLAQRPVTRSFDVFFGLRLNKRLSKTIVKLVI